MKKIIPILLTAFLLFPSCAWFENKEEKTADQLIRDGMRDFQAEDYRDAIESFEKLKDWYPFSKYAILAELKTADAYYNLEEYEDAVFAYEEFENLHPRNEAIPYVVFQTGMCYFERIDTVDRDQDTARKALTTFRRLQEQFPKSAYASKGARYRDQCLKSLAEHELYVGKFYLKTKHYKSALYRLRGVLANFPDIDGIHSRTKHYISLCEANMKDK